MRFYTKQHKAYCGIDLHARTMYICIVSHDGEILVHHNYTANPQTFLTVIAPSRDDLVVAVACLFPWYWLADLCAREGIPFVLGPALYMNAIHGGNATNDRIDAQKTAVLLRGGLLPQAYVSPMEMRATRDLRRRRLHCMRKRAELLPHVQQTNRPYHLPAIGKQSAYQANRAGVAARVAEPAGQKRIEVDLPLMDHYDHLLREMALTLLKTAKPHDANTRSLLRTVPAIGAILRLVRRYAIHDVQRFPRGQDLVSSCRLGNCAKAAAGKRSSTAGTNIGHASLTWAFSAAAVLLLRANPAGQKSLARSEKTHGKGQAFTVLTHKFARAVYSMFQRGGAFDLNTFFPG